MNQKLKTTLLAMLLCLGIAAQAAAQESAHVSAADYINSGVAKFNKGDMDGAIADYNRAIAIDPGLADAYVNRGAALGAQGDLDAALTDENHAIALDPKSALGYMNRGNARRFKGDLDGALADYNSSIDLDPKSDLTYVNRGNVKSTKGDVDGAIADYNRAIELNPNFARSYYCRGNDRGTKGDQDGALADYTRAIELRPKYNDACDAIAWLLATSWQPSVRNGAKAVDYATKACEMTDWKDMNDIDTLAAACAENGDYDNAVKWETKYLAGAKSPDKDASTRLALYQNHQPYHEPVPAAAAPSPTPTPKDADAYYSRGVAEAARGDKDAAIADFTSAIGLNPNLALAYLQRALAKYSKGDLDGTIADCTLYIGLDPQKPMGYNDRGIAEQVKGDLDAALADYNRAIGLDPNDAILYFSRGLTRKLKGDLGGAIIDYKHSIELDPKYPGNYNGMAWILATAQDPSMRNGMKAFDYATKACELSDWKDMHSIDTLAAACAEDGDFDQAVKWETKYIAEAKPPDKDAPSRLALYQNHQPLPPAARTRRRRPRLIPAQSAPPRSSAPPTRNLKILP